MATDQLRRLAKLEQAINPRGRLVGFWDDGTDVNMPARFRERGPYRSRQSDRIQMAI
jgi:hypothetical protein